MSERPPEQSAIARRKRRLLVLESEQWHRSAWLNDLREQMPPAAKSGYAAARKDSVMNRLDYALIVVAILSVLSAFTRYLKWGIAVYVLLALVFRTPSQRIFSAAALSLLLIPLSLAFHGTVLADDFATIALYALGTGVIRLAVERVRKSA